MLEYPKRFVKYQLSFLLEGLTIRLVDEDLVLHRNEATTILTLKLESVGVHLRQRPAAALRHGADRRSEVRNRHHTARLAKQR